MTRVSLKIEVGDVVRVDLEPTKGNEKKKEGYYLVVEKGNSYLNLIIILPITEDNGKRISQFFIPITNLSDAGLHKPSVIDCYQIRTIAIERLVKTKSGNFRWGIVDDAILFEVRRRLAWLLDIGEEHVSLP